MKLLVRETYTKLHEAPLRAALFLGLVGALVGYTFAPKGPQVEVYNGAPAVSAATHDAWAPSKDPSIASTTKVDNLDATTEVLARGHFRITSPTGPTITSGAGAPAAAAPAGSVYYRTDGTQYDNTDGTGGGWTQVFQSGTFPSSGCGGAGEGVTTIGSNGLTVCNQFLSIAGTSLSSSGATVNLNFPTTACAAGSAITSHASSGAPSCSAFFNAAGDHLSSSGSTVSLAQIATASFLGRTTAGTGNVETLTATQATALLNTVTTAAKGLAPTLPNDATKYLDGTGAYSVPPGSGGTVTSVSAGQSISVSGTTAVTVALNFPTTACSAGQAVTSHNSAGTPSCSTFFNAAGDHLSASGSTVSLAQIVTASFLGRTTAGTGNVETLTGTQATALLDTVTTSANGLAPTLPNDATKFLNGVGGYSSPTGTGVTSIIQSSTQEAVASPTFDGTTTISGIVPSGGNLYTFPNGASARDYFWTNITINNGVSLHMSGSILNVSGTLTCNGGQIDNNGASAVGAVGGAGGAFGLLGSAASAGGGAGVGGGASSSTLSVLLVPSGSTSGGSINGAGNSATLACAGGGGGGAAATTGGSGGGNVAGASAQSGGVSGLGLYMGGASTSIIRAVNWNGGSGGGGGGAGTGTGGGGGGPGGPLLIRAGHLAGTTCTISSNGGAGANGVGAGGSGAGGGGGWAALFYSVKDSGTWTVSANGGSGGAGGNKPGGNGGGCYSFLGNTTTGVTTQSVPSNQTSSLTL